jgi:restriction endonuclease S subunit
VTIRGGGTPSRSNEEFFQGDIPWVTPKDMKKWEIDDAQLKITREAIEQSAANEIPLNTVLLVVRSGVLKHTAPVAINRRPIAINQDMKSLQCNGRLVPEYLARFLKHAEPIILSWVRATTADNYSIDKIRELPIPLPSLDDQRRIAAILDQADDLRRKRCEAFEKLREMSPCLFLELFGHPLRAQRSFPTKELKALGRVITGSTPPSSKNGMFGGPVPFVTPSDLESNDPVRRSLTSAGAQESRTVKAGSTLVCCIGATIGKMGIAAQHCAFNQQINAVDWGDGIEPTYGFNALTFFEKRSPRMEHLLLYRF